MVEPVVEKFTPSLLKANSNDAPILVFKKHHASASESNKILDKSTNVRASEGGETEEAALENISNNEAFIKENEEKTNFDNTRRKSIFNERQPEAVIERPFGRFSVGKFSRNPIKKATERRGGASSSTEGFKTLSMDMVRNWVYEEEEKTKPSKSKNIRKNIRRVNDDNGGGFRPAKLNKSTLLQKFNENI